MFWLLLIAGGSVAFAFFLLMDVTTQPARERTGSIRRAATYGKTRIPRPGVLDDGTFRDRALVPMTTGLARVVLRVTPRASVESVNRKLLNAGLARKVSPTGFLALKGIVAVVPDRSVTTRLDFGAEGQADAHIAIEPQGAASKVTWSFDANFEDDYLGRYFGVMMDGLLGPDYEKGLANLQRVVEQSQR